MTDSTEVTSKEFSWEDMESVVVKSVQAIAVYLNSHGDLVIRQQCTGGPYDDEDSFIVLPIERVDEIISAMKDATGPQSY